MKHLLGLKVMDTNLGNYNVSKCIFSKLLKIIIGLALVVSVPLAIYWGLSFIGYLGVSLFEHLPLRFPFLNRHGDALSLVGSGIVFILLIIQVLFSLAGLLVILYAIGELACSKIALKKSVEQSKRIWTESDTAAEVIVVIVFLLWFINTVCLIEMFVGCPSGYICANR